MTDENRDPEVEVKATPMGAREYARALLTAWKGQLGTFPTKAQLGVLYGQYMVETSGRHVYNFNIGNIKEIPNDGLPYMALAGVWEMVGGKRVELPKTHPGSRFTAFESMAQGADWYLKKIRLRFGLSWPYVEKGDPDGFARALKRGPDGKEGTWDDYYSANADDYARLLRTNWQAWMKSTAYDEAIRDLLAALEAPTEPAIRVDEPDPASTKIVDFAIIHPRVPLRGDPEDPPDDAA